MWKSRRRPKNDIKREKCGLDSSDSGYIRVMESYRQDINLISLKVE